MNPYFAISAIFLLGLRGIKKMSSLPGPPISEFTPEDRENGKVSKNDNFFQVLVVFIKGTDKDVAYIIGICHD